MTNKKNAVRRSKAVTDSSEKQGATPNDQRSFLEKTFTVGRPFAQERSVLTFFRFRA
jgi:hypothetical protein